MKKNTVQNLVNKNLKQKIEVEQTIGMENPYNYRDKAQFPVGVDKKGNPVVGVFANRTHEIIPIDKCLIQTDESQEIAKFICEFAKENNRNKVELKKYIAHFAMMHAANETKENGEG